MNLNKKIVKTMVFALGLGMLSFAGVSQAKASGGAAEKVFNNQTGTYTAAAATKYWAVAKKVKDVKKANVIVGNDYYVIKPAEIEDYLGGINVSSIGEGKDVIIAFGAAKTTDNKGVYTGWEVAKIGAANKKFKVHYLGSEHGKMGSLIAQSALGGEAGYLAAEEFNGKKSVELDLDANKEKVFVKVGDGSWATFKDFIGGTVNAGAVNTKLKALIQRGANLTFKYAKDKSDWLKDSKLKIPAQPKAPKIGVDMKKDLVTSLKSTMEYQAIEKTEDSDPELEDTWTAVPDKAKTLALTTVSPDPTKTYVLFVRNKADKKKVSSKITKVYFKGTDDLEEGNFTAKKPNGYLVGPENTPLVTISLARKYDVKSGAIITNTTTDDYEYYVDGGTSAALPANAKWTLLKGKKKAEDKDVIAKVKYSKTSKPNSYGDTAFKVLIRKAGTKIVNGTASLPSNISKVDVEFAKIEQAPSVADPVGASISDAAISAKYNIGEGAEISFSYKVTNYQGFDKKPKLEMTKNSNVSVKVSNFETETGGSGKATITVKLSKSAKETVTQAFKLSVEGADPKEYTVTFTPNSAP